MDREEEPTNEYDNQRFDAHNTQQNSGPHPYPTEPKVNSYLFFEYNI